MTKALKSVMREVPVWAVVVESDPGFIAYAGGAAVYQVAPRAVFYRRSAALAFAKELRPHLTKLVRVERVRQCPRCGAGGYVRR